MTSRRHPPAIVGVGSSQITRNSDRSLTALALDAAIAAITDAGLQRDDIDGYVGTPSATNAGALHANGADELGMRLVTDGLGLRNIRWGVDLFWDFPTTAIVTAGMALSSGACEHILVVRAMSHPPGVNYAAAHRDRAHGEEQFAAPFGYKTAGARFAMRAREYLEKAGTTRHALYDMVALARSHAARNPLAIWRDRTVTLDEYMAAPMISSPICRMDCDMPVSGAIAFVVTRGELATQAPHPPVYLAGATNWQQPERIFEVSGRQRADVQLCQLYDGFSCMPFEWLERLGWCAPYTAWQFIRDGGGALDSHLPINTFGGSLGEGRLHGAGHIREAVLQLSGRAHGRQVRNAENCLVQVGPHDIASLLMLSSTPG